MKCVFGHYHIGIQHDVLIAQQIALDHKVVDHKVEDINVALHDDDEIA